MCEVNDRKLNLEEECRSVEILTLSRYFEHGPSIIFNKTVFYDVVTTDDSFIVYAHAEDTEFEDVYFLLRKFNRHDNPHTGAGFLAEEVLEWITSDDCMYDTAEDFDNIKNGRR